MGTGPGQHREWSSEQSSTFLGCLLSECLKNLKAQPFPSTCSSLQRGPSGPGQPSPGWLTPSCLPEERGPHLYPQPTSWFQWEVLAPLAVRLVLVPFCSDVPAELRATQSPAQGLWHVCWDRKHCHPVSLKVRGKTCFHAFWFRGLQATPKQVPLVGQEASSLWFPGARGILTAYLC